MKCPKCNSLVNDSETKCPNCHKVLLLECPNCHSLGKNSVCDKCGFNILVKCVRCKKLVPLTKKTCKCGFSTLTSLAYQECETDEFASIIVKFESLNTIKKYLKSKELYAKFFIKLKNILFAQIKNIDCKLVIYNNVFVINMCKDLSFTTSSNKAIRLALKILNSYTNLNLNMLEEFSSPLNLSITILKKQSEDLLNNNFINNNVKPLIVQKKEKKYLKGLQLILDQYVRDEINKEYKTDSLYTLECEGKSISYYEVLLDSYVLPPSAEKKEMDFKTAQREINKNDKESETKEDLYSFNVFDINAKCSFEKTSSANVFNLLSKLDFNKTGKILSFKSNLENSLLISDVVSFYKSNNYRVLTVACSESLQYKSWGVLEVLFRDFFQLPQVNKFLNLDNINEYYLNTFKDLFSLITENSINAMSPEDARFAYMDLWCKFLSKLDNTVIIIEDFQYIDDTTLQTLNLYFDKFKNLKPNFLFISTDESSPHFKMRNLLKTDLYTEISIRETKIEECLELIKSDASDFIQSFYYEKIKENFNGSFLYFINAIEYLKETGVLIDFENKLIVKNKKSVILPTSLAKLYKARIKNLNAEQNKSLILAYLYILSNRFDVETFINLNINETDKLINELVLSKLLRVENNIVYVNNSNLVFSVIAETLQKNAEELLVKNIICKLIDSIDSFSKATLFGKLGLYKEEYLALWKNSQFAIKTGDYDAYLKSCIGFLSLIEYIDTKLTENDIENNKLEVYNNILMYLYSYSPTKIYFIEKMLLMDALKENDDDKIIKLSNLMLQGALLSSNYTDAIGLLHNILTRIQSPILIVDGNINTKFLLLSLVNIEILYNIGDYRQCVEIASEILSILNPEIIRKIKPASFSINLFINHIQEILRLAAFAKLQLMDDDIEDFFAQINNVLNIEFLDKDCIMAIKDFLSGKVYVNGNVEEYSPFSKIIFLILQEFSLLDGNYKRFAQNIYQAKLLANEISSKELEMFCELLIAYAYFKIGLLNKAEVIYKDLKSKAEASAMYLILLIANYLIAKLEMSLSNYEDALRIINDSLLLIQKFNNQSKILYAMLEKLYIEVVSSQENLNIDMNNEIQKLNDLKEDLKFILQ